MEIGTRLDVDTPPSSRRGSYQNSEHSSYQSSATFHVSQIAPQTPPESAKGSPHLKEETTPCRGISSHYAPVRLTCPESPANSPVQLPSLAEFDAGVKAIARSYGHPPSWDPYSPESSPKASNVHALSQQRPLPTVYQPHSYTHSDPSYSYHLHSMPDAHMFPSSSYASYPSPPPDKGEGKHCNKKYTTEEGDYIIYAWHDKNQKWETIRNNFARLFGSEPNRTVQGLQAWYYRMNQRIPVWDDDGWLLFHDEEDIEPQYTEIKCRDRDAINKSQALGLAQRYPERAIHYAWVDEDVKRQARSWAAKRNMQYQERKERRKRKEQRRGRL